MGKAKPVSLHPLSFDDALKALIRVDPGRVRLVKTKVKTKPRAKKKAS